MKGVDIVDVWPCLTNVGQPRAESTCSAAPALWWPCLEPVYDQYHWSEPPPSGSMA